MSERSDYPLHLAGLQERIEKALAGYFPAAEDGKNGLREAMRYSLLAGGKRIRPVMCLEFCRICGGDVERCLPIACGIEMLHTYSLIHDDLPCMDDDDLRRGKPSCHKQFGETTAVLAGDCLQAEAFETICSAPLSDGQLMRCCRLLSNAAGLAGICGGQHTDLSVPASAEAMVATEVDKTATLLAASCAMGAAAAGASQETERAALQYGLLVGLAFQLRDDVLDGDGLCALLGTETCDAMASANTQKDLEQLDFFQDTGFLRWLTIQLAGRES
ncbi:MAG: polyprenyl synthetase family protein [Oscillospiraceae bacterium]|nr:polyprenyl synthetase family protein [Oscillospiraceae bacterium]